jgi:hypothetical protein
MGFVTARDGAEIFYKDWGSPHGITDTHKDRLSDDLLALLNSTTESEATNGHRRLHA